MTKDEIKAKLNRIAEDNSQLRELVEIVADMADKTETNVLHVGPLTDQEKTDYESSSYFKFDMYHISEYTLGNSNGLELDFEENSIFGHYYGSIYGFQSIDVYGENNTGRTTINIYEGIKAYKPLIGTIKYYDELGEAGTTTRFSDDEAVMLKSKRSSYAATGFMSVHGNVCNIILSHVLAIRDVNNDTKYLDRIEIEYDPDEELTYVVLFDADNENIMINAENEQIDVYHLL